MPLRPSNKRRRNIIVKSPKPTGGRLMDFYTDPNIAYKYGRFDYKKGKPEETYMSLPERFKKIQERQKRQEFLEPLRKETRRMNPFQYPFPKKEKKGFEFDTDKKIERPKIGKTKTTTPEQVSTGPGLLESALRGMGSFGLSVAKTVPSLVEMATDPDVSEIGPTGFKIPKEVKNKFGPDKLNKVSQELGEGINDWAKNTYETLTDTQVDLLRPLHDQEPGISNIQELISGITQGTGSLLAFIGIAAITKNLSMGAGFLTSVEGLPTYRKSKKAGKSSSEALRNTFATMAGIFALENVGINYLFRLSGGPGSLVRRMAQGAFGETLQEEGQTVWQNLVNKYGIDKSQGIFEGWFDTILVTMPIGAGGAAITPSTELAKDIQREANVDENTALGAVRGMFDTYKESIRGNEMQLKGLTVEDVGQTRRDIEEKVREGRATDELAREARKYDSAEEFVRRDTSVLKKPGIHKTKNRSRLKQAIKTKENAIQTKTEFIRQGAKAQENIRKAGGRSKAKLRDILADKDAKDGIKAMEEIKEELPTESQLKQIYNQAVRKMEKVSIELEGVAEELGLDKYGISDKTTLWIDNWINDRKVKPISSDIIDELSRFKPQKPITLYRGIRMDQRADLGVESWSRSKKAAKAFGKIKSKTFKPEEIILDIKSIPSKVRSNLIPSLDEMAEAEVLVRTKPEVKEAPAEQLKLTPEEEKIAQAEMMKEATEAKWESSKQLLDDIQELGGIKSFRGGFMAEEISELPINLKNNTTGQKIDELTDMLNNRGYNFESDSELMKAIQAQAKQTKVAKTEKKKAEQEVKVLTKTRDVRALPERLKKEFKWFFRPSRKQRSRLFGLVGNKDTTIPLFSKIFDEWAKGGIEKIIEPYAGAYTLGMHSIDNAIKSGINEFHSNIFETEKYLITKAIQDGKSEEIKSIIDNSIKELHQAILKSGKKYRKVRKEFKLFIAQYPDSYIGSKEWYSFITDRDIGKRVVLLKDEYQMFQKVFQDGFDAIYPKQVIDLNSAVKKSILERVGVYNRKGQSLVNSEGFRSIDPGIYGKYGMVSAMNKVKEVFELAEKYNVKINLYSEDGADFLKRFKNENPKRIGFYLDPPYIKTAQSTYKETVDQIQASQLAKFAEVNQFVGDHKLVFDFSKEGAKAILTNDIHTEYIEALKETMDSPALFGYKENVTPTSLITDKDSKNIVYRFLEEAEKPKGGERAELATIKELQREKQLSSAMMSRIREAIGITELKNTSLSKLDEFIDILRNLEVGERILSIKHREALEKIIGDEFKDEKIVTRKMVMDKFGSDKDVVHNLWVPVLYGKRHNRMVQSLIDLLWDASDKTKRQYIRHNEKFIDRVKKARKASKKKGINADAELFDSYGRLITQKQAQKLSPEQQELRKYLKGFFNRVADTMTTGNKRFQYIPHIKRGFFEAWKKEGLIQSFKELFKDRIDPDIAPQVWANFENIVANQKFSRFALPRKGGLPYTTDLIKIMEVYSKVYFTKKNFDPILPTVNAFKSIAKDKKGVDFITQYAKTLTGQPLDLKSSPVIKKILNAAIEYTYYRFLAFNYKAGFVNTVVGKMEQFVHQSIPNMAKGEKRFQTSRGQKIIKEQRIVDESIEKQINAIGDLKRMANKILFFNMRGAGRFPWGENWIQGSQFLGELTKKEYLTGKISRKRYREIIDKVERAQGPYRTATRPMLARTAYGRLFTQMKLWLFGKIADRVVRYSDNVKSLRHGDVLSEPNRQTLKEIALIGLLLYLWLSEDHEEDSRVSLWGSLTDYFSYLDTEQWGWTTSAPAPAASTISDLLYTISAITSQEKYKTSGRWGDVGDPKWVNRAIRLLPAKTAAEEVFLGEPTPEKVKPPKKSRSQILKDIGLPPLPEVLPEAPSPELPKIPEPY